MPNVTQGCRGQLRPRSLPSLSLGSMPGLLPQRQLILRIACTVQALRGCRHLGKWGLGLSLNQEPWGSGLPSPQLSASPSVRPQPSSPSSPPRVGALAARWHCDLAERRPPTQSSLERRPPLPRGRAARARRTAPLAGLPTACPASPCCPAQPRPSSCLSHRTGGSKSSP